MSQDEIEELEALIEALELKNANLTDHYEKQIKILQQQSNPKQDNKEYVDQIKAQVTLLQSQQQEYIQYYEQLELNIQDQKKTNLTLQDKFDRQLSTNLKLTQTIQDDEKLIKQLEKQLQQERQIQQEQSIQILNLQDVLSQYQNKQIILQQSFDQIKQQVFSLSAENVVNKQFVIQSLQNIETSIIKNTELGNKVANAALIQQIIKLVKMQ